MTESSGEYFCRRFRLLQVDVRIVHCVGMEHQAADALLRLKAVGGGRKTLKDAISVTERLDKEYTQNEQSEDNSDEEDFDNRLEMEQKEDSYEPTVNEITKVGKKLPGLL